MNWNVIRATKAIRTTITGHPRCRASPVQTPPSQAPSATRVARGRPEVSVPGVAGVGTLAAEGGLCGGAAPPDGPGPVGGPAELSRRLESVVVMMSLLSHVRRPRTSRVLPHSTPEGTAARRLPEPFPRTWIAGGLRVVPDGSSLVGSAGWL